MDRLYTPWRFDYIKGASCEKTGYGDSCVFCALPARDDDENTFILHRASRNFVILNIYPYTSGHLMVVPFEHTADLPGLAKETADELTDLSRRAVAILGEVYRPHGFNLGMNQGAVAGAGIAEHLHQHVVPRWAGDANFLPVVGQTKALPQLLDQTWEIVRNSWDSYAASGHS